MKISNVQLNGFYKFKLLKTLLYVINPTLLAVLHMMKTLSSLMSYCSATKTTNTLRLTCVLIVMWYLYSQQYSYLLVTLSALGGLIFSHLMLFTDRSWIHTGSDKVLQYCFNQYRILRLFFAITKVRQFPCSIKYSIISRPMFILVDNIIAEFVLSWHTDITLDKTFPKAVRDQLLTAIDIYYSRCGVLDKHRAIEFALEVYYLHLEDITKKQSSSPFRDFKNIHHPASAGGQVEDQYLRAVTDLLMRVGLTKENYECEALRSTLREILSTNVFGKVIDLISNPSFLYQIILDLLDDEPSDCNISDDDKKFIKDGLQAVEHAADETDEEDVVSFTSPRYYSHNKVRIPKVKLFGEGLTRFAVYVIEYSETMWERESLSDTEAEVSESRLKPNKNSVIGRRFKEFNALHERLVKSKVMRPFMKDIHFPSRESFSSFPFNRLDKDFLTSRRDLFNQYLNQICKVDMILNSTDFKEFLGHQQSNIKVFTKKPMPFIDTKFGQSVSKMFNNLTSRLVDQKPHIDAMNRDRVNSLTDISEFVQSKKRITSISQDHNNFLKSPTNADIGTVLEKFIHKNNANSLNEPLIPFPLCCNKKAQPGKEIETTVKFSYVLLGILQQLFNSSGTILSFPGFTKILTNMFYLPLNRYIINEINDLTSEKYWFFYLTKLNKVLFDEKDETEPEPVLTEEQFKVLLMKHFEGPLFDMINVTEAVEVFAESLKSVECIKSVVYVVLDHLIEGLIPEVNGELKELYRKS